MVAKTETNWGQRGDTGTNRSDYLALGLSWFYANRHATTDAASLTLMRPTAAAAVQTAGRYRRAGGGRLTRANGEDLSDNLDKPDRAANSFQQCESSLCFENNCGHKRNTAATHC